MPEEGKKTKCPHCGYEWEYTGRMMFATCPNCQKKAKVWEKEK